MYALKIAISRKQRKMLELFKSKQKTAQARILIIDDDLDLLGTIQRKLEHYQWQIDTAANGREGLAKIANKKPDLILLDIKMPIMNGHEMLEHLRKDRNFKDIPVIMCTRCFGVQDVAKAASYNISAYIAKPFDCTELTDKIYECLNK